MTNEQLVSMLQDDLKNERKHLGFYLQASVMIEGLHREELREFLEEQAKDEFQHVIEFSEAIIHLGGVPGIDVNSFPTELTRPRDILEYARDMENEVATVYAGRLVSTEDEVGHAPTSYIHLFYEDQIQDSWKTAQEINQMLKGLQRPDAPTLLDVRY